MATLIGTKSIAIDVVAIHMTDVAILARTEDGKEVWFPFSMIDIKHRGKPEHFTFTMLKSFAKDKGLI